MNKETSYLWHQTDFALPKIVSSNSRFPGLNARASLSLVKHPKLDGDSISFERIDAAMVNSLAVKHKHFSDIDAFAAK